MQHRSDLHYYYAKRYHPNIKLEKSNSPFISINNKLMRYYVYSYP